MENLLDDIETFLKARGMAPTTFGQKALNDPAFVFRLRASNGQRDMKVSTIQKVRNFMLTYEG
jgi:hypothetical protein